MIKSCHYFVKEGEILFHGELLSPMDSIEISKEIELNLPVVSPLVIIDNLSFSGSGKSTMPEKGGIFNLEVK